jgi:hypothetical protein
MLSGHLCGSAGHRPSHLSTLGATARRQLPLDIQELPTPIDPARLTLLMPPHSGDLTVSFVYARPENTLVRGAGGTQGKAAPVAPPEA